FCRAFVVEIDTLLTGSVRDILHPSAAPLYDQYIEALRRDGIAHGKMLVRTATGECRIWEYRNTVRTDGVARPIVRGLARDVTDLEFAQRALRRSEEHIRAMIENASDLIGIIDPDRIIRYISPSAARIL